MANFTWNYWVLQGSGWAIGYEGTGSATVSRANGSDTAAVTAQMKITSLGGDAVAWTMHVKIGSSTYTTTTSAGHTAGRSYTMTINRNVAVGAAAGSLKVQVWMTINGNESLPGGKSAVKSATLSYPNKGASPITSAANKTLGNACDIRWTPLASTFKYRLKFILGSWSYTTGYITPGSTSAYTYTGYTLPATEALISQIPNSRTGSMTVTLYSYDADNKSLGTDTKTFTVTVPGTVAPTISSVQISGEDSTFDEYVTTYSKLTVTVTASGIYGSTMKTAVITVGNKSYTAEFSGNTATVETEELSIAGSVGVVTTVTDSRGITATQSNFITVYEYFVPQVTGLDLVTSDTATTVAIAVTGKIAPVNDQNDKQMKITATRISDGTVVTIFPKAVLSNYTINQTITQTIADIETESYLITVTLFDSKYTSGIEKTSRTGIVCVSRLAGGLGMAIFREATADDLGRIGIKGKVRLQGRATFDDPTGYTDASNDGIINYRTDGSKIFWLGRTASTGAGGLWLYDSDGKVRFFGGETGYIHLDDSNGKVRTYLTSNGTLTLYDENAKARQQITASGGHTIFASDGSTILAQINSAGRFYGASTAGNKGFLPIYREQSISGTTNSNGLLATPFYVGNRQAVVCAYKTSTASMSVYPVVAMNAQTSDIYGRWYMAVESHSGTRQTGIDVSMVVGIIEW